MEKLPENFINEMHQLVDAINPGSLLVAGERFASELINVAGEMNIRDITSISGESMYSDICARGIFDLVILTSIESMQKKVAMQMIGRIRDFHAKHLLVMVLTDTRQATAGFTRWQRGDLIACGMRLFNEYESEQKKLSVYRFELSDYKITPEWFNSKYWANPELFDKYRW